MKFSLDDLESVVKDGNTVIAEADAAVQVAQPFTSPVLSSQ